MVSRPDEHAQSGAHYRNADALALRAHERVSKEAGAPDRSRRSPRCAFRRRGALDATRINSPAACASASRLRSRSCTGGADRRDEPTTAWTYPIQAQILTEIAAWARSRQALIWISHDLRPFLAR